jgi:hypothetical protein
MLMVTEYHQQSHLSLLMRFFDPNVSCKCHYQYRQLETCPQEAIGNRVYTNTIKHLTTFPRLKIVRRPKNTAHVARILLALLFPSLSFFSPLSFLPSSAQKTGRAQRSMDHPAGREGGVALWTPAEPSKHTHTHTNTRT